MHDQPVTSEVRVALLQDADALVRDWGWVEPEHLGRAFHWRVTRVDEACELCTGYAREYLSLNP